MPASVMLDCERRDLMKNLFLTLTVLAAFGMVSASHAEAARRYSRHARFGRMAFVHHQSPSTMHHVRSWRR